MSWSHWAEVHRLNSEDKESDEYAAALQLFSDHEFKSREDFDKNYDVPVQDICSPETLDS